MATLQDVARELGISASTVSRALSGHPHVNEQTRQRVRNTATRLNYQPNVLARALRNNQTRIVGLVIPDILNQFYAAAATFLQATLDERDYRLIVCISNDRPESDLGCLTALLQHRVDGIVHVPCTPDGAIAVRKIDGDVPIVELNRRSRAGHFDAVVSDDGEGAYLLMRHLLELGHERIGVIAGAPELSTTEARIGGVRAAMLEANIAPENATIVHGAYTFAWGVEGAERLLAMRPRPTAIFATGNQLVPGALHGVARGGLHVPHDISLVGFDDPDWFAQWRPPITTYALPLRDMGRMAAQLLLARMSEPSAERSMPTSTRLTGHLMVRASTAPPAGPAARA